MSMPGICRTKRKCTIVSNSLVSSEHSQELNQQFIVKFDLPPSMEGSAWFNNAHFVPQNLCCYSKQITTDCTNLSSGTAVQARLCEVPAAS